MKNLEMSFESIRISNILIASVSLRQPMKEVIGHELEASFLPFNIGIPLRMRIPTRPTRLIVHVISTKPPPMHACKLTQDGELRVKVNTTSTLQCVHDTYIILYCLS